MCCGPHSAQGTEGGSSATSSSSSPCGTGAITGLKFGAWMFGWKAATNGRDGDPSVEAEEGGVGSSAFTRARVWASIAPRATFRRAGRWTSIV